MEDGSSTFVHVDSELGESKPKRQQFIPRVTRAKISLANLRKSPRFRTFLITAAIIFSFLYVVFAILAYYVSYTDVYFNSKIAINILRNSSTLGAVKFFIWLLAIAACIPNAVIGYQAARVGLGISRGARPSYLVKAWTLLWVCIFLAFFTASFWIRPAISSAYHTSTFNHGCAANGWDWDVVLGSPNDYTVLNTVPVVGTANILSTRSRTQYTAELSRHDGDQLHFNFTFTGTNSSPFPQITYDWGMQTYTAWRPNSTTTTNISGTYITSPNLSFQSLNLSLLDNSIPFQRPDFYCWPAAATLVLRNSTSKYFRVLQSLTLDPNDKTRMKVCGMAGSVDEEFHISLGVVLVNHFYYSLCSANQTMHHGGRSGGYGGVDGGGGFDGGDAGDEGDGGGGGGGSEGDGDGGGGGGGGDR